eukprot:gb/GECG01000463.1/.p1 GENE.gb/GECG01000463.1/~~gb/GECG01000463.1/.p1  ORF type:complete len:138 (+),score=7.41 gb/GECG01000463.1/:1-414(+)
MTPQNRYRSINANAGRHSNSIAPQTDGINLGQLIVNSRPCVGATIATRRTRNEYLLVQFCQVLAPRSEPEFGTLPHDDSDQSHHPLHHTAVTTSRINRQKLKSTTLTEATYFMDIMVLQDLPELCICRLHAFMEIAE